MYLEINGKLKRSPGHELIWSRDHILLSAKCFLDDLITYQPIARSYVCELYNIAVNYFFYIKKNRFEWLKLPKMYQTDKQQDRAMIIVTS